MTPTPPNTNWTKKLVRRGFYSSILKCRFGDQYVCVCPCGKELDEIEDYDPTIGGYKCFDCGAKCITKDDTRTLTMEKINDFRR